MKNFSTDFYNYSLDEKVSFIGKNPRDIFLIDKSKIKDSLNKQSTMYNLKLIALQKDGSLLKHFENAGLTYDQTLVAVAIHNNPYLIKDIDKKWLSKEIIKDVIKQKITMLAYVPVEFMDLSLYNYCNKYIRTKVRSDPSLYNIIPEMIKKLSYTACNAFIYNKIENVKYLNNEQLTLNRGKLMYQTARRDPKLVLNFDAEVWRRNLMKLVVSREPELYLELTEQYKKDPLIQYYTYKAIRKQGKEELFDHIFSKDLKKHIDKKIKDVSKRKGVTVNKMLKHEIMLENAYSLKHKD